MYHGTKVSSRLRPAALEDLSSFFLFVLKQITSEYSVPTFFLKKDFTYLSERESTEGGGEGEKQGAGCGTRTQGPVTTTRAEGSA